MEENRSPRGWAVGVPHSAATARNRLRNGEVPQRRPRSHVPHTLLFLARWVARSSVGSRVARRLPGRHFLVAARPLRCRPGLSVGRRGSGRPPPCVLRWSFARRHVLDTSFEQYVGRPSHDRTTERHWQRLGSHRATVPKEVPCGSSTPAAAHATSPGAVAVRLSSVPFLGGDRPGWSEDSRWVHSRPVQRVVGTVG